MGEDKPWWIRGGGCSKSILGKCFLVPLDAPDPQVLTPLMGWEYHFILGKTVIFLRADQVAWSLQSSNGLGLKTFGGSGCKWFSPNCGQLEA